MRAHLARRLLAGRGVAVDIATTGTEGARFLAAMGSPATVLPSQYRLAFDPRHGLDAAESRRAFRRYALDARGLARDLWRLRDWRRYDLVVDDSFHPALVLAPGVMPHSGARIVHVWAEHLRDAVQQCLGDTSRWSTRPFRDLCDRAFACVEHGLHLADESRRRADVVRLPPLLPVPRRDRMEIRRRLGVATGRPLAVVYLNPRFRDPRLADAVHDALVRAGAHVHAVAEGIGPRPGWRPHDAALTEAIAAADLFVAGPGMGALGHVAAFGVPMLALLGRQPEQARNARDLARLAAPHAVVSAHAHDVATLLHRTVVELLEADRPPSGQYSPASAEQAWADTFIRLVHASVTQRNRSCPSKPSKPMTSRSSSRPTISVARAHTGAPSRRSADSSPT